jgi:hypothetical protein
MQTKVKAKNKKMRKMIKKPMSKFREREIEQIKALLQDPTLRGSEKFNLSIYLKSLQKDGKE